MSLLDEVNEKRREIRTDGYSISIGEWISLYEQAEIDIHPEFQRFYRWNDSQKTNLIESILLGIPIPPVFVSQREDGIWDVVDGLQRLSTIYQLLGILLNEKNELEKPLVLTGTKYLPSLEGKKWNDTTDPENSLSQELRLIIKRAKIGASIILKESDKTAKFDLFQRLNTGGTSLSPQEVRNCILVMLDTGFYDWLKNLCSFEPFQDSISLADRPLSESYDLELALRFIIFCLIDESELNNLGDVGIFITEKMQNLAIDPSLNRDDLEDLFKNTFQLIYDELEDQAFKRFNVSKGKFSGGFLLSQYEVLAYGIAYNIYNGHTPTHLRDKTAAIWKNEDYTNWSGSGITATRRLPRLIPLGREVYGNGN